MLGGGTAPGCSRRKWAASPLFLFSDVVGLYRDIPEGLREMIEPVVEGAGFELVDVLIRRGGQPWLVRITIDTPSADGRVPVEPCAVVSRRVQAQLDAADAVPACYPP